MQEHNNKRAREVKKKENDSDVKKKTKKDINHSGQGKGECATITQCKTGILFHFEVEFNISLQF